MIQRFLEKCHALQRVSHQQQGAIKGKGDNSALYESAGATQEPGGIPSSGMGLSGRQGAL
jgi:hypothetical protein